MCRCVSRTAGSSPVHSITGCVVHSPAFTPASGTPGRFFPRGVLFFRRCVLSLGKCSKKKKSFFVVVVVNGPGYHEHVMKKKTKKKNQIPRQIQSLSLSLSFRRVFNARPDSRRADAFSESLLDGPQACMTNRFVSSSFFSSSNRSGCDSDPTGFSYVILCNVLTGRQAVLLSTETRGKDSSPDGLSYKTCVSSSPHWNLTPSRLHVDPCLTSFVGAVC